MRKLIFALLFVAGAASADMIDLGPPVHIWTEMGDDGLLNVHSLMRDGSVYICRFGEWDGQSRFIPLTCGGNRKCKADNQDGNLWCE